MKKLASVLLLIGIFTPYSCDVRPIETLWSDDGSGLFFFGVPVLLSIAYAFHNLAPAFARTVGRRAEGLHWWLRLLYFGSLAGWLVMCISDAYDPLDLLQLAILLSAVFVTLGLYLKGRRQVTLAMRIPLLALAIIGLPAVFEFLFEFGKLQYGAWIFSAGYALAVAAELREPKRAP